MRVGRSTSDLLIRQSSEPFSISRRAERAIVFARREKERERKRCVKKKGTMEKQNKEEDN